MDTRIVSLHSSRLAGTATGQPLSLRACVEMTLHNYFTHLDGTEVTNVYQLVLNEVEAPLLATVLQYTGGNQSKAAEILGLNRGTLRKKLKEHNLL
ncbi:MAG: DNA-binding transcriptional regulator Fis [Gammaproteobacteria bacterium]|jgi:Fis family transcriptional regulator|nr:DNA-binding transcriptional regulator Fis [Gammaproteobacteria bacterium]